MIRPQDELKERGVIEVEGVRSLGVIQGPLDGKGNRLQNIATPTAASDAATKAYVDGHYEYLIANLHIEKAAWGAGTTMDVLPLPGTPSTQADWEAVSATWMCTDNQHTSGSDPTFDVRLGYIDANTITQVSVIIDEEVITASSIGGQCTIDSAAVAYQSAGPTVLYLQVGDVANTEINNAGKFSVSLLLRRPIS